MIWTANAANRIAEAQSELLVTQNEVAESQKEITEKQALIDKTSYTSEFVYLGPEEKVMRDDKPISERYYYYGFNPRFAKVSDFAEALSYEVYDHYELEIAPANSPTGSSQWIAADACGHHFESSLVLEASSIVMKTKETKAKFCPSASTEEGPSPAFRLCRGGRKGFGLRRHCVYASLPPSRSRQFARPRRQLLEASKAKMREGLACTMMQQSQSTNPAFGGIRHMPSSSEISPVAQAVLRREAERIAALGDGWAPTYANLREIAERVLAAEREEQARKQAAGIERARAAGSLSGRPAVHQVPENFSEIYRQLQARERTIAGTARELGVSASTLSRWIKSERERLGEGERK